ncbi:MAG: HAMP domain-containing protein [Oscillospiraceae bacterium]|nr:HAMP domain-containing protein [Oscillospiraceae bacterium]
MITKLLKKKYSLKQKFTFAFALVISVVLIICSLSVYSFEVLFSRQESLADSFAEINRFRSTFDSFNENLDEYFSTGSQETVEKYNSMKSVLIEARRDVENSFGEGNDEVENSLVQSICSDFDTYITQTDELVGMENREEAGKLFSEKYSKNAVYISEFTEKFLVTHYRTGDTEREKMHGRILLLKILLSVVLFVFAGLVTGMGIIIFRYIVEPVEKLSRQTRQIANFNFDIDVNVPKTGDEIEELSVNFSNMKDSLRDAFETNKKNIQVLDDMLIQFEGNKELKAFIDRQRELSDDIFRQANIDEVSGLMNGNAFTKCVNHDISVPSDNRICAVSVVEITNYSEIGSELYEGVDELVKSVVKKLSYLAGENGYIARWNKEKFIMFFPDAVKAGNMKQFSRDVRNAVDDEFVYNKTKKHVDARVNTLVSHNPRSEKMLINYVVNGIDEVKPGNFRVVTNNIL